jgi:hypothetical protein
MSTKINQPRRTGRPPPDIQPPRFLKEDAPVEVSADTVRPAPPTPEQPTQPFDTVFRSSAENVVKEAAAEQPGEGLIQALRQHFQCLLLRLGYRDTMELLAHTANGAKLVPAFDNLMKVRGLLGDKVPAIETEFDLNQGKVDRDQLVLFRELEAAATSLARGFRVLAARQEVRLDWLVRGIFELSEKEIDRSYDLSQLTEPLQDFVRGPAQQAVESRGENERLRERTETETLDKVKEAISKASATPASGTPASTPGTPPPAGLPDLPAPTPKGRPRGRTPRK